MSAAPQVDRADWASWAESPPFDRGEIELDTGLVRRFLGNAANEPVELVALAGPVVHVAHVTGAEQHARAIRAADKIRGYRGAYQLVNGPLAAELTERYKPNAWHPAKLGRAADRHVQNLRAIYIDVDVKRLPETSSTDAELRAALEVASELESFLAERVGKAALGQGVSGNGAFTLIAVQPTPCDAATTQRISRLLNLLNEKFGAGFVKIDAKTCNPARLMPAPGSWKRKGTHTAERPHRRVSFTCRPTIERVALEAVC